MTSISNGQGGGSEIIGYNAQEISALTEAVKNIGLKAKDCIIDRLNNEVVVPMSTAWFAPEAIEFFERFSTILNTSAGNMSEIYGQFCVSLMNAASKWAETTGGSSGSVVGGAMSGLGVAAGASFEMSLNTSVIQANNGGSIYIDEAQATNIAGKLLDVQHEIKSDLENCATELEADAAFLGRGQADAVESCFVKISGEIDKVFNFLTEGDESMMSQIKKTVEKYSQAAAETSSQFNNMQ